MGAGAMASCSTRVPPSTPVRLRQERFMRGFEEEELQAAFQIDVELSPYFTASIDVDLPAADHLTVFTHPSCFGKGRSEQEVHHLSIQVLKSILVAFLTRRNEWMQQQTLDLSALEVVLSLPATKPYPPIELYIMSSSANQLVRVLFDSSRPSTELKANLPLVLQLQLCGHCGEVAGCACGWRQRHTISPQMEQRSIREFIGSTLPQLSPSRMQAIRCYHLHLGGIERGNSATFDAQIYRHDIRRPMIESPYVEFKAEISLGKIVWRIARRYREFTGLHTMLKMVVEEWKLPQLPPTTWLSVTDPSFLFLRRRLLEKYLKGVLMIEALQGAVPLLVFLGVLSTSYVDHVALRSYRRQILHLQVLEFYTHPGDLILFNGRAKASKLLRSMTRSEWDHVAIVVPSRDKGQLQLLEATGDGVMLCPLVARLLAYSTFHVHYFSLRRLRTPLLSRSVVNDLLERFTAEVEGLSYGLSIRRILHAQQPDRPRSKDSTFFCSELVAEAYKALGLISSSRDSMDFWPGSFSPGSFSPGYFVDAELARHGASLSPEIIIDCKLLEVATATRRHRSRDRQNWHFPSTTASSSPVGRSELLQ